MENKIYYQKLMFKSVICTNKGCRKRRVYVSKDEEKLKISKLDNDLFQYSCECGNNIIFKY